ncbi:hypothetical protein PCANC_10022 [Puccinia coronata f. sp. avenae]|uniref:UmuC domain-containing protein n=1 Tax=Puccinia coronata f. sp. avenae TaxID=200324 RepID=A0A2N5UZ02_9BASI|nr:hypothetical protein PCANC_10022 [Puccinia coronata f. sp. avenae]
MLTYRQLYSKKIGPNHPLRVIAHCDVDAAYAQFEQVRLKIPPDKPLAVQQWRGRDAETEAKYHHNPKPETHKVSLDPYRRESVKILRYSQKAVHH